MNNEDQVLLTGIKLKITKFRGLKKDIREALPEKGMEVSKEEAKELQETIIKEIKILYKRIERRKEGKERNRLIIELSRSIKEDKKMEGMTKEKFKAYVKVQESGLTNMFNIAEVIKLSDFLYNEPLTKEECLYIMKNYRKLKEQYK